MIEGLTDIVADNFFSQRATGAEKSQKGYQVNFDSGAACEKQDVLAALKQSRW